MSGVIPGCQGFKLPPNLRRALLINIALSYDPDGTRRKGIERVIAALDKNFSPDEMMRYIKEEEIQYGELQQTRPHQPHQQPGLAINEIRNKPVLCMRGQSRRRVIFHATTSRRDGPSAPQWVHASCPVQYWS